MTDPSWPQPRPTSQTQARLTAVAVGYVEVGWRIETLSPQVVILVGGRRPNHLLHGLLTAFTCVWLVVWSYLALFKREERLVITAEMVGDPDFDATPEPPGRLSGREKLVLSVAGAVIGVAVLAIVVTAAVS